MEEKIVTNPEERLENPQKSGNEERPENPKKSGKKEKIKRTKTQKALAFVGFIVVILFLAVVVTFIQAMKPDKAWTTDEAGNTVERATVETVTQEEFKKKDVYINSEIQNTRTVENESGEMVVVEEESAEDYLTIMLYGVDARNNTDLTSGTNGDSQILCVINMNTYEVRMVSLLRDTLVQTTTGKTNKLTDIYAAYGVKEALGTMNMCFDLQCTDYVCVNWSALCVAVECIGGIDLYLTQKEVDYINDGVAYKAKVMKTATPAALENVGDGVYHLGGVQVVTHCGNRTTGGQDDINRARRQREVIVAALQKAKTCDLVTLYDLYDSVMPAIATNIDWTDILEMLLNVGKFSITESTKFPFKYTYQQDLRTAYVYCNTLADNVIELHRFLFDSEDYVPSTRVQELSAYISQFAIEHP